MTAEITYRQRTTFDDYGAHKRGGYNWATISTSATCLPNNGEPGTQKNGRDLVLMNQKLVRPKSQIRTPKRRAKMESIDKAELINLAIQKIREERKNNEDASSAQEDQLVISNLLSQVFIIN